MLQQIKLPPPGAPAIQKPEARNAAQVPILCLDIDQVSLAVGLSKSQIEKMVRQGKFPAPRQISGRRVAYLVSEILAWLAERPLSSCLPPENCGYGRAGKPAND